jgi:quercetin dioxygenase-like cupin family protein
VTYELRVVEDRAGGRGVALAPAHRVIYVVVGAARVRTDSLDVSLAANQAWQGSGRCRLELAGEGARAWRWELGPARAAPSPGPVKLARTIDLTPGGQYLLRCDRVDFPLGGIAYTHTHRGPGIRVLLEGRLRVEVGDQARTVEPGEAWFERGPEPVYAMASDRELTSFVRVLVLPAELQGQSSIRYVKPEDRDRPKPQRYTVFVDAPIAL